MVIGTGSGNTIYVKEIESIESSIDNIMDFIDDGEIVVLAENFDTIELKYDGIYKIEK